MLPTQPQQHPGPTPQQEAAMREIERRLARVRRMIQRMAAEQAHKGQ